jgi:hypothetical protein
VCRAHVTQLNCKLRTTCSGLWLRVARLRVSPDPEPRTRNYHSQQVLLSLQFPLMVKLGAVSGIAGSGFRRREQDVSGLPTAVRLRRVGFQDVKGVAEGALAFSERRSRLQRNPVIIVRIAAEPAVSRGNVHLGEHCRRHQSTVKEGIRAFRRHRVELLFRGRTPPHRRARPASHTWIDVRLVGDANDHSSQDAVRASEEARGAHSMNCRTK